MTAAIDSTTSTLSWRRVVAGAAWAGVGAALLDLVLFLGTARSATGALSSEVLPRAVLVAALLAALLALAVLVLARLRRWDRPAAVVAGTVAGVLAAQLDLVLARFQAASVALSGAWPSLVVGVVVGLAVAVAWRGGAGRAPRPGLSGALLLVLVAGAFLLARAAEAEPRVERSVTGGHDVPRVILIVADTLRADGLSCLSSDAPPTPHLDAFASGAWTFRGARSPAPWTLPAMCSLLTGVSPLVHGAVRRESVLPRAVPTLAERFAEAGYRTAAMGHNAVLSRTRRLDRGFDEYDFARVRGLPGKSLGVALLRRRYEGEGKRYEDADELVARAADWVAEHADEDFFLWLHFYDPHLAYAPPAAHRPEGPPPPGMPPVVGFDDFERIRGGYLVPDADGRAWTRALYDAEVRFLDERLGSFFDRLRALGLYEDTLLVFTSDHGEEFWEHGGFEHGHTAFEEVLRVPLLVKLPGQASAGEVDHPVTLESVVPTLLRSCGLRFDPAAYSAPALFTPDGAPAAAEDGAAWLATGNLYYEDRVSLVFDGWKYVRSLVSGEEELYHLARDPGETVPLQLVETERLEEARRRCAESAARHAALREALGVEDEAGGLGAEELQALRDIGYAH